MKMIACFKWVIDEADIKVDAASRKLVLDRAGYKISAYDRNAIEEATLLKERNGGTVSAMTVAPPTAKACLKDALSRGPDDCYFVNDTSFVGLEPTQTAAVLAAAIRPIEFDLIVCGEGSGDIYAQQVAPLLAETLGIPCATCVNQITVEGEGRIKVGRKLEEGVEYLSMPLPAVVSVLPDINTARIPTLKQVLGAAKKPVHNVGKDKTGELPAAKLETKSVLAATMDRKQQKFAADEEGIRAAVNALIREGVI